MYDDDVEIIECRECGAQFDVAKQRYYDNLCPPCKDENDPGAPAA
jgi:Zn finger protein HypA/HybF involved in hydrogenase expression